MYPIELLCLTQQHFLLFSTDSGPFVFLSSVVDAGNEVKVDGVAYGTKGRRRGRQQLSTTFTSVAAAFFFEVKFQHRRIQIGLETLSDRLPVPPFVLFLIGLCQKFIVSMSLIVD